MGEERDGLGREPTSEEVAMAASGLPALAFQWVDALRRRDIDDLWPVIEPQFRLGLAQMWIWYNRAELDEDLHEEGISRDELAEELAKVSPQHPLWVHCARVSMRTLLQASGDLDREFGLGSRPRMIGPGLELLRLFPLSELPVDEHGDMYFPPGASVESLTLIMKLVGDQWMVAGIGHHLLRPGWPPTHEEIAIGTD